VDVPVHARWTSRCTPLVGSLGYGLGAPLGYMLGAPLGEIPVEVPVESW
jgi:hypothetical protein